MQNFSVLWIYFCTGMDKLESTWLRVGCNLILLTASLQCKASSLANCNLKYIVTQAEQNKICPMDIFLAVEISACQLTYTEQTPATQKRFYGDSSTKPQPWFTFRTGNSARTVPHRCLQGFAVNRSGYRSALQGCCLSFMALTVLRTLEE